ncbi:amidohydrolase family protein [Chryseolinea sp. T2]|uniref:amidohydrolase family protein n=1 Tax=Chryseolinea sp. T2 TaxID=3129255 RepID=UPI00307723D5
MSAGNFSRPAPTAMRTATILHFLFALALFQTPKAIGQQLNTTLLINGNVVDVETGKLRQQAVLIEGDKIKALGDYKTLSKKASKDTKRIDCKGKYIIPGLWDMHVHLEGAELVEDNALLLPVFLAYGITTIRDCASDLGEQVLAWRNDINTRNIVGPTIFTAGRKLEGKNSIWKGDLEIENETELNDMLNLLDKYKVDFVKITENTLGGELFLKSVAAAHARGYRVSGHVPIDLTISQLVDAGFTSVEHAGYLLRLGSDDEQITRDLTSGKITKAEAEQNYSSGFDRGVALQKFTALGKKGLFVCPTFIGGRELAYLSETDHSKDMPLRFLTEKFVSNYQWRIQRMSNETAEQRQQRKDRYLFLRNQLPLIHQSGIRIIAGSDAAALNTYVYPAESLIQELEIFQEAGLKAPDIMKTATINGSKYFGIEKQVGTLTEGKQADLVVLDKNPLEDIRALRAINGVMKFGNYYDRTSLDNILKSAEEKKTQLDRSRN